MSKEARTTVGLGYIYKCRGSSIAAKVGMVEGTVTTTVSYGYEKTGVER